jgi:hypothetical protein
VEVCGLYSRVSVFEFGKWYGGLMFCVKEYTILRKIKDGFSKGVRLEGHNENL